MCSALVGRTEDPPEAPPHAGPLDRGMPAKPESAALLAVLLPGVQSGWFATRSSKGSRACVVPSCCLQGVGSTPQALGDPARAAAPVHRSAGLCIS